MKRIIEWIFGLERGFLNQEGDYHIQYNPRWPGQEGLNELMTKMGIGPYAVQLWNFVLVGLILALVVYVYRREGRSKTVRISLAGVRLLILGFLLFLLNMPVFTISQSREEPSVLAVMVDDSISMRVKDVPPAGGAVAGAEPVTRLDAVRAVLTADQNKFLADLGRTHTLRFYKFSQNAAPVAAQAAAAKDDTKDGGTAADPKVAPAALYGPTLQALAALKAEGKGTQVLASLRTVVEDLQGQRLAGVVMITDGRSTPKEMIPEQIAVLKNFGHKIYPVIVGSDKAPRDLAIDSVNVQDAAFEGDIVNIKTTIRGTGYPPGHRVKLTAINAKTKIPLRRADGKPVEKEVTIDPDKPQEVELQWKPDRVDTVDIDVVLSKEPGELDDENNNRAVQVAVLDAKLNVLYVDGYPRWEYRYIKNEMIRDVTVNISCLLTSADPTFAQEGDPPTPDGFPGPIKRFPESIEEILKYDVVIFGDVDPRQFTDAQLQLIKDFVSKRGGGFGLISGPKHAPVAYKNTAIEDLLPVFINRVEDARKESIPDGWRPELTKDGLESSVFRFFEDKARTAKFIKDEMEPLFWFSKGVQVKPGVGETYAQHPGHVGPDGKRTPILVLGRYGAGRTLFSGVDDTWRWRFYTGESVFDTYWIQQFRYLARSKKLGQRKLTFGSNRPAYDQFEQVQLSLRILDPQLLTQLPDQIPVEIVKSDEPNAVPQKEMLVKQEGQVDYYIASYTADRTGKFTAKLPPITSGVAAMEIPITVSEPKLEFNQPQVDRTLMTRLAAETNGAAMDLEKAPAELPNMILSAAKQIPVDVSEPLWNKDRALWIFVLLLTGEWVLRKTYGML